MGGLFRHPHTRSKFHMGPNLIESRLLNDRAQAYTGGSELEKQRGRVVQSLATELRETSLWETIPKVLRLDTGDPRSEIGESVLRNIDRRRNDA